MKHKHHLTKVDQVKVLVRIAREANHLVIKYPDMSAVRIGCEAQRRAMMYAARLLSGYTKIRS